MLSNHDVLCIIVCERRVLWWVPVLGRHPEDEGHLVAAINFCRKQLFWDYLIKRRKLPRSGVQFVKEG